MRILTLQAAYFPMIGGAELFHQQTAEYMASKGHQVDVLTCVWEQPDQIWKTWKYPKERLQGTIIYRVRPWFYMQYLKSIGAIWPLYRQALKLHAHTPYDLIHAHIFPALIVGGLLKQKLGIPLVTTIQGGDIADYSETSGIFSTLLKPFISYYLRKTNMVHTVSTHMKMALKVLGCERVHLIPNGVDTQLFRPLLKSPLRRRYKLPQNAVILISHSRLTPKNGLDLLLRAMAQLKSQANLYLLIIGGGEQVAQLKSLIAHHQLQTVVKLWGYQPQKTTAELLACADMFVRPSRAEGFGISFLEAMACGLPVIGTHVGGIVDIVETDKDGILVKPNDVLALSEAIQTLIEDPQLRNKMGKHGRQKAIKQYPWNQINQQLEQLYHEII